MASRTESHWCLLGGAFAVGLFAALVSGYLVALIPLAAIDRFVLVALAVPTVWVLACLHVLLSMRPRRATAGYIGASAALLVAGLAVRALV